MAVGLVSDVIHLFSPAKEAAPALVDQEFLNNLQPDDVVVFLIHGTFSGAAEWWQPESWFTDALEKRLSKLGVNNVKWLPVPWPLEAFDEEGFGSPTGKNYDKLGPNSEYWREQAGIQLASALLDLEEKKRSYILIGHSHGGSVAHHALSHVFPYTPDHMLAWITVGTPFLVRREKWFGGWAGGLYKWLPLAVAVLSAWFLGLPQTSANDLESMRSMIKSSLAEMVLAAVAGAIIGLALSYAFGPTFEKIGQWWKWQRLRSVDKRWKRLRDDLRKGKKFAAVRDNSLFKTWIGFCDKQDEAVNGLRAALGVKDVMPRRRQEETRLSAYVLLLVCGAMVIAIAVWLGAGSDALFATLSDFYTYAASNIIQIANGTLIGFGLLLVIFGPWPWGKKALELLSSITINLPDSVLRWFRNWYVRSALRDVATGRDVPDYFNFTINDTPEGCPHAPSLPEDVSKQLQSLARNWQSQKENALLVSRVLKAAVESSGNLEEIMNALPSLEDGAILHTGYFRSEGFQDLLATLICLLTDPTPENAYELVRHDLERPPGEFRPIEWIVNNLEYQNQVSLVAPIIRGRLASSRPSGIGGEQNSMAASISMSARSRFRRRR